MYPFVDGPWGGANQFLKAIRGYLTINKFYTENIEKADVILFNSSPMALDQSIKELKHLKFKYQNKIFINRIDGPVFFIRDRNLYIDKAFYQFNDSFCDGTIFQSNWSKDKNYFLGMNKNNFETTILNAPNPKIFNIENKSKFSKDRKIKLIATSWSSNIKKGFEIYEWLDENIDFDKYEMTFVGNSPIKFKNIKYKKPMDSEQLSAELKQHDIFITASQSDPCSNSLIEAIHCGLPAIGLNDGGHTEIIGSCGKVYNNKEEILEILEDVKINYDKYQSKINLPNIEQTGKLYYEFMKKLYDSNLNAQLIIKQPSYLEYLNIKTNIYLWKLEDIFFFLKKKLRT